jgi:hypothetical protein
LGEEAQPANRSSAIEQVMVAIRGGIANSKLRTEDWQLLELLISW